METNVNGAKEQLDHEKNGLIVDINKYSIYQGIKRLIDDKILRDTLIKNLKGSVIDTRNEVNKLDLFWF